MKRTLLTLTFIAACTAPLNAQDNKPEPNTDSAREAAAREVAQAKESIAREMKAARQEVAELEKAGKKDEAVARRHQAEERLKAAQAQLEERVRGLRAFAEPRRDGDRPDSRPEAKPEPHRDGEPRWEEDRRPGVPARAEIERKLGHVEQAIGHLREAGLAEPAEHLTQVANRLRASLRGEGSDGPRREEGRREEGRPPQGDIEALRREVQELRQAVREIAAKQNEKRKPILPDQGQPEQK